MSRANPAIISAPASFVDLHVTRARDPLAFVPPGPVDSISVEGYWTELIELDAMFGARLPGDAR